LQLQGAITAMVVSGMFTCGGAAIIPPDES